LYRTKVQREAVIDTRGFNKYRAKRTVPTPIQIRAPGEGTRTSPVPPVTPVQHGIRHESRAIGLFLSRHGLSRGFAPPYVSTGSSPLIGGRGDYVYQNHDGSFRLLEVKCPLHRSITQSIPFAYWLQVQTMLHVYHQLGLPIDKALYCENRFSRDSRLIEHWEMDVEYDERYFNAVVIPCLNAFSTLLSRKRKRSGERPWVNKRSKGNNRIIARINGPQLYRSYLECDAHDSGSLRNHFNNDHLLDWLFLFRREEFTTRRLVPGIGKFIRSPHYEDLFIGGNRVTVDVDRAILPRSRESLSIDQHQSMPGTHPSRMQLVRMQVTLESLKKGCDVILGAQLFSPKLGMYAGYDMLIRSGCLKAASPEGPMADEPPGNYLVVQFVNGSPGKNAKAELYAKTEVLNAFFHRPTTVGLVISGAAGTVGTVGTAGAAGTVGTHGYRFNWIDFRRTCMDSSYRDLITSGKKWLEQLHRDGHMWSIDPPSHPLLYPNLKIRTGNPRMRRIKGELAHKNGELTQLWSLSARHRNLLAECELKIDTIDGLNRRLDHPIVKRILGSKHEVIRSIVMSHKRRSIINGDKVTMSLTKSECLFRNEMFLDFEFNDKMVYMIGFLVRYDNRHLRFGQLTVDRLTEKEEEHLFEQFKSEVGKLLPNQTRITCYHWGQVERSIINKKCPELNRVLDFVDLNRLLVQCRVGIPSCFNYGLKGVAKALKRMNLIPTNWNRDVNGHWCNGRLSEIYDGTSLRQSEGISQISEYNRTDCQALADIVDLFRSKC